MDENSPIVVPTPVPHRSLIRTEKLNRLHVDHVDPTHALRPALLRIIHVDNNLTGLL